MSRESNGATNHRKLMVIDDDALSLAVISLLLRSDGYEVLQAADGATAIELLGTLQPDTLPSVLLADLRMPGIQGRDLAVALRATVPQAKLLAMSATADTAEGYDGFLKKPLDLAALQSALQPQEYGVPEPATPTDPQVDLDEAVYAKLMRMMPQEAVREIYETCLNDVRARAAEMRIASTTNDLASVRLTAHAIKGGAGMVGAQKLAAVAAVLELGDYKPADVPQLVDNLLSSCDRLQRILLAKLQI